MKPFRRRYVHPEDFRDLRRFSDLTRKQAADLLSVSVRTIQNWETGGARIPWMAYRMLRILQGYALPGKAWEGWSVHGDRLIAPNGRWYEANTLEQIEVIFGMARLWRKDYLTRQRKSPPAPGFGTSPHGLSACARRTVPETREALCASPPAKPVLTLKSAGGGR